MASTVEHVWITHPDIASAAYVPALSLPHYVERGWSEATEVQAASAAATGGEVADLSQLTRQELLDRAQAASLPVGTHPTKAELVALLTGTASEVPEG